MSLGAHHVGDVALIEIGCEVFSTSRRDPDDYPVGGIVVDTIAGTRDEDTGFPTGTFYVVVDPYRTRPTLRFHRIAEDDIDREAMLPPNTSRMCRLVRALCQQVAQSKGSFTPQQAEQMAYAAALTRAVMGGVR